MLLVIHPVVHQINSKCFSVRYKHLHNLCLTLLCMHILPDGEGGWKREMQWGKCWWSNLQFQKLSMTATCTTEVEGEHGNREVDQKFLVIACTGVDSGLGYSVNNKTFSTYFVQAFYSRLKYAKILSLYIKANPLVEEKTSKHLLQDCHMLY